MRGSDCRGAGGDGAASRVELVAADEVASEYGGAGLSYDEILMIERGRVVIRKFRCPRRTSILPGCVVVSGCAGGRVPIEVFVPVLKMLDVADVLERMDITSEARALGDA